MAPLRTLAAAIGVLLSCCLPALVRAQDTHAPGTPAFDSAAAAIWREQLGANDTLPLDTVFAARIARLAGVEFQAKADRLTPDLDSALSRAVMSGGRLRESPWGWLAYARVLQATRVPCIPLDSTSPRDWLSGCRRVTGAYRSALSRDSTFAPVIAELDRTLPWPKLWDEPERELALRGLALERWKLTPAARRALERRQLLLQFDAEAPADIARRIAGGADSVFAPGERAFLHSRLLALEGNGPEAMVAYGVAASDTGPGDQLKWIHDDLGLTGSAEELATWDSLPVAARQSWIREFWAGRDYRDGLAPGERIVRHAERWRLAFHDYRMVLGDRRLRGPGRDPDAGSACGPDMADSSISRLVVQCNLPAAFDQHQVFDDRGLAFLRHGAPQLRVRYPGSDYWKSESWVYTLEGGRRVIHFNGDLRDGFGMGAAPMPRGDWMTACQVVSRYCVLAARRSMGERIPPERMRMVVEHGIEEMEGVLTTDDAIQRFAKALPLNATSVGLGGTSGRATVAVDVPLASLRELADSAGHLVLRWQLRVRDTQGQMVVSRDTVRRLALPPAGDSKTEKALLVTLVDDAAVPPGSHDLRLVVSDTLGQAGALYHREGMVVLAPGQPGLSDIVLMPTGAQGVQHTIAGETVRLSPTFSPGATRELEIGYLLTNLAGQAVKVAIAIRKVGDDSARARIEVASTEQPRSARQFVRRRLSLKELGDGAYDLVVTITLPDGTTQERKQRILVRE